MIVFCLWYTGLNNLKVVSVLDESYAEYFGFTQNEVDSFLEDYGIIHTLQKPFSYIVFVYI